MEFLIIQNGSIEKFINKANMSAERALATVGVFLKVAEDIFRIEESIFHSEGRRGGGSWKRLKEDTIKRKGSVEILRSSDSLYRSVTEPGAEYQILEVDNTGIIFGTDRPWAGVQQFGSTYKNRPARPFIKFTPYDTNRWNTWIIEHLMEPFNV